MSSRDWMLASVVVAVFSCERDTGCTGCEENDRLTGSGDFRDNLRDCLEQTAPSIPAVCVEQAADALTNIWGRFLLDESEARDRVANLCARFRRGVDEEIRNSGDVGSKRPDEVWTEVCGKVLQQRYFKTGLGTVAAAIAPELSDDVDLDVVAPCGEHDGGLTVCASPSFPPGDFIEVAMVMAGPVPLADPVHQHQYGFVFDADGDPTNNYRPAPAYPYDFFQDTDRWYVLAYQPLIGWKLEAKDARGGAITNIASAARASILGAALFLHVPASEMPATCPAYRMTAFTHEGDFGLMGGPWSADTEPTVDKPLETSCTTL